VSTPAQSASRTARALIVSIALVANLSACGGAVSALGTSPTAARDHAQELIGSLAARFGPVTLDSAWSAIRPRLLKASLAPSRIYDDSAAWTQIHGAARTLELSGRVLPAGGATGYQLAATPGAIVPRVEGEYRHVLHLVRSGDNDFRWDGIDLLGVGGVSVIELASALDALLIGAGRGSERLIREEYRTHTPRATACWGRLLSVDSIAIAPLVDGSSSLRLQFTLHPDWIAKTEPALSSYLAKYVTQAMYNVQVTDATGAQWWNARAESNRFTISLRLKDGKLAPLGGPVRPMPDTLLTRIDVRAHVMIFTVGLINLVGDLVLTRQGHERGFAVRFHQPPQWVLPPLVGTLLKSPLRRPFEGGGSMVSLSVRDTGSSTTLVERAYSLPVRESAIVRWFGGLGNAALSDYRRGAEKEGERFLGTCTNALRDDAMELAGAP
jgi:hypothetical protein